MKLTFFLLNREPDVARAHHDKFLAAILVFALAVGMLGQAQAEPPVVFQTVGHVPLGSATLNVGVDGLQVAHIGSSGQDGVRVGLDERCRVARLNLGSVNVSVSGAALGLAAYGMVDDLPEQALGTLELQGRGNATDLILGVGETPIATAYRMEVYSGDSLVHAVGLSGTGPMGTLVGDALLSQVRVGDSVPSDTQWTLWELVFDGAVGVVNGGADGDRVRVVALNPVGVLQNLALLDLTGRNLDSWTIRDEQVPQLVPRLQITRSDTGIQLTADTRSVVYESAPTVNGPWNRAVEGTLPPDFELRPDKEFFRVVTEWDPCIYSSLPGWDYLCQRNVLLLIADDVGVDLMPCYIDYYAGTASGSDDITVTSTAADPVVETPTVDRLVESGVMFLNAWSSQACSPTRAGLYTGTHAFRPSNLIYSPIGEGAAGLDPADVTTFAGVLHDAGYTSALFGKWHLGASNPLEFGWDRFSGSMEGQVESYYGWNKVIDEAAPVYTTDYATTNNVEDALDWIADQADGPWMATIAFNAPHWAGGASGRDYELPPTGWAYSDRSGAGTDRAAVRSMLECLDRSVASLLARMDEEVLEKTTIIFVGDNGTEGDITDHFAPGHAKGSIYEGGVRVPLIIADGYAYLHGQASSYSMGKGRVVAPNRVETAVVQTVDLFATVAEIGRGNASSGLDSVSMVPYLYSASATPQRDVIFAETRGGSWSSIGDAGWKVAVRGDSHKLIVKDFKSGSETYELYNVSNDPWETTDLLADGESKLEGLIRFRLRACLSGVPLYVGCP